tara:strand:+ start:219 stop:722 length:504 start_codon:yes stop_codon:yes gene_type:complete
VAAISENNVIGKSGEIPWIIPKDMSRFKRMTTGYPVIMGRKTYESLPDQFRPLPNRENFVLSRNENYKLEGAKVYSSLEQVLDYLTNKNSNTENENQKIDYGFAFVIGGGSVYQEALPLANHLELTHVDKFIENGDAFFPEIDYSNWDIETSEKFDGFSFVSYSRKL